MPNENPGRAHPRRRVLAWQPRGHVPSGELGCGFVPHPFGMGYPFQAGQPTAEGSIELELGLR